MDLPIELWRSIFSFRPGHRNLEWSACHPAGRDLDWETVVGRNLSLDAVHSELPRSTEGYDKWDAGARLDGHDILLLPSGRLSYAWTSEGRWTDEDGWLGGVPPCFMQVSHAPRALDDDERERRRARTEVVRHVRTSRGQQLDRQRGQQFVTTIEKGYGGYANTVATFL